MPTDETTPPEPKAKRPRRWRRFFLVLTLLLAATLVWFNGPGSRLIIKSLAPSLLEKQNLTGSFDLEGSLLTGFQIKNLHLTGPSQIQEVRAKLIQISWSPKSLLDKHLNSLHLDSLHLTFDPSAPPASPPKDPSSDDPTQPLNSTLNLIRPWLEPAEISLRNLSVTIPETTDLTLESLTHSPNTSQYLLKNLHATTPLPQEIDNPETLITWTSETLTLDQFTLLPTLALKNLRFTPDQSIQTDLFLDQHQLTLQSNLSNQHTLELLSPNLPLSTLTPFLPENLDLDLAGEITELSLDSATEKITLAAQNLRYQDQALPDFSLHGTVTPAQNLPDSSAQISFTLADSRFPEVTGHLDYQSQIAHVTLETLKDLTASLTFDLPTSSYQAEITSALSDPSPLTPFLAGPLHFHLTALGNLDANTHTGTLDLTQAQLLKNEEINLPENLDLTAAAAWDWPTSVQLSQLTITSPQGQLLSALAWQNDQLEIQKLEIRDPQMTLLEARGSLPAPLDIESLDAYLKSTEPLTLTLTSKPLTLQKIASLVPFSLDLDGIFQADLTLTGSPQNPALNGFLTLDGFEHTQYPTLPKAKINLNFKTENQTLTLTGQATEPQGPLLTLKGNLPFLPHAWLNRTNDPNALPLDFQLQSSQFNLQRLQPFAPQIARIDGSLNLDILVAGTLDKPTINGSLNASLDQLRLRDSPVAPLQKSNLNLTFTPEKITVAPSTINAAGGFATLQGTVDLAPPDPLLNLTLRGQHVLLHRTEDYTFRGNPNLTLTGPFSKATLGGSLDLVESLFYKDIEILPFGAPTTTEVPVPNLPTFSKKPTQSATPAADPSPVMGWNLDLQVKTLDPILIRGNLARGQITGAARVFGTLGDPKTSGTLTAQELLLDLPFSNLNIPLATVTLQPNALTNPLIDLKGTSQIGQYTVQVYLNGPVQNPNLTLTSSPPLVESEIMLLLATGSATSELEDESVASQKALQYLLEGLRRRNQGKDKTVLQRILKNSNQIDLSLGDRNQFSGRQFSSATVNLTDQWDFSTQIDDAGETRALVIFSLRFR